MNHHLSYFSEKQRRMWVALLQIIKFIHFKAATKAEARTWKQYKDSGKNLFHNSQTIPQTTQIHTETHAVTHSDKYRNPPPTHIQQLINIVLENLRYTLRATHALIHRHIVVKYLRYKLRVTHTHRETHTHIRTHTPFHSCCIPCFICSLLFITLHFTPQSLEQIKGCLLLHARAYSTPKSRCGIWLFSKGNMNWNIWQSWSENILIKASLVQ